MGYRPDDQALVPVIEKIEDGVSEFSDAVKARILSDEWDDAHLRHLADIYHDLLKVQLRLLELGRDTW